MPSDNDRNESRDETETNDDRFIESERRPAHADETAGDDDQSASDSTPDHVTTEMDELPEDAQAELASANDTTESGEPVPEEEIEYDATADDGPSEEFIEGLPEEDQRKFRGEDDSDSEREAPDTAEESDATASDEKVSKAKERTLAKAEEIREKNAETESSSDDDPLSKYENQDFSDFTEVPDAWEYTVAGRDFLLVPPEARPDDETDTTLQAERERAQKAMRKAEQKEDLSEEEQEEVRMAHRVFVQNMVYAPTITTEMWESWSETYQNRVFSAVVHFVQEEVAGFTRERKDGFRPAKQR